jgi:hypothetical protein
VENLEKPMKTVLYRKCVKYHCEKFGKAITATAAVVHPRRPNFHKIFSAWVYSRRRKSGSGGQGARPQQMMHQPGKHMMPMMPTDSNYF